MLAPNRDRFTIKPTITLATLKSPTIFLALVARVGSYPKAAAARADMRAFGVS